MGFSDDIAKGISSAAIADEATSVAKTVADGASSVAITVADETISIAKTVADETTSVTKTVEDGASSAATTVADETISIAKTVDDETTSVADETTSVAKTVADGASSAATTVADEIISIAKTVDDETTSVAKTVADGASSVATTTVADETISIAEVVGDETISIDNTVDYTGKTVIDEASKQIEIKLRNQIADEEASLLNLLKQNGDQFPGSDYHPHDRKQWMSGLNPHETQMNKIVWPGTHDSATNGIGIIWITRPFAQCQTLSIYDQLVLGTRVFDIRIEKDRNVCHGPLVSYGVQCVIDDIKKFFSQTQSEIIILEVGTEYDHKDPPEFDKYLIEQLGEFLIHQDDHVFTKTIAELLPKRIICVWKPRNSPEPRAGGPLWSSGYLRGDWTNTDLPKTKFDANLTYLGRQQPASERKFFYKVENTATGQLGNLDVVVATVTGRIHGYARLFINRCFAQGIADRLQIFSIDFIDENFVDACVGLTKARIQGIV